MIKTLLNADEEPPEDTAVIIEEKVLKPTPEVASAAPFSIVGNAAESDDILELPRDHADMPFEPENASEIFDARTSAPNPPPIIEQPVSAETRAESPMFAMNSEQFQPESTAETIRNSGLAYAAAVILLASIVFMLILGWFADLLFGTSPWGIVVGIVLGSIIGFVQFFRTTSQILKK